MTSSVPDAESKDLLLRVLDWDGNLIKAFRPAGLTSYSEISCSPAPGIIYATTHDSDMTHLSILRFVSSDCKLTELSLRISRSIGIFLFPQRQCFPRLGAVVEGSLHFSVFRNVVPGNADRIAGNQNPVETEPTAGRSTSCFFVLL